MLGTVVNTLAILMGSCLGLFVKGGLKERYRNVMVQAVGMAVLFIGLSGSIGQLISPDANPILFIISLVIGGLLGEKIDIEGKLNQLGDFIEQRIGKGEGSVAQGFVSSSLLFCVGTMSILGAFESGITGNNRILYAKSILDGISSVIFASTLGFGVLLSAASVLIYQGLLTLLASVIQPYLTDDMIREISIVGGVLITGLGFNFLNIVKMKVGNFLPAILIPVIYYLVLGLF